MRVIGRNLLVKSLNMMLAATAFSICTWASLDAQTVTTLTPGSYTTTNGGDGGQSVTNLTTMNESGLANDWSNYVEFYARSASATYAGYTSYTLPTSITPASVTGIQVQANYLGPATSTQVWTWQIYDWVHGAYVSIGDNTFATGWGSWKVLNFNVWGNLANYVRSTDGAIRVQLLSSNSVDDANIDYQAVVVTSDSSNPTTNNSYYVSTSGSDDNAGTSSEPWKTIQHAADSVGPGSTVYVEGGTYNEQVTLDVSGTASGGYIRFQSYPGQTAILDGTDVTIPYSSDSASRGLVQISNVNYVTIEGFEIQNIAPNTSSVFPSAITVSGSCNHVQIRSNKIHDINNSTYGAHGIGVYGNSSSGSIDNLVIDGNQLYNLTLGYSESMHIDGDVENWTVSNNQVHDTNNIGIDALGFYGTSSLNDQARNGVISGNLVYNANASSNPVYTDGGSASGIYVDGGTEIVVDGNISHDNNIGIQVSSEKSGKLASYVTVRNNVIYNNTGSGISMGGYSSSVGSADHTSIVNNSLFENDSLKNGLGEVNLQYFPTSVSGNIFENNAVYTNAQGDIITSWVGIPQVTLDYNLYYTASGLNSYSWVWNSTGSATLAAWKTATSGESHSAYADPTFVLTSSLPPDLFVNTGSPAIGAGTNLGSTVVGTTDFNGQTRVQGTIDVGAYEQ